MGAAVAEGGERRRGGDRRRRRRRSDSCRAERDRSGDGDSGADCGVEREIPRARHPTLVSVSHLSLGLFHKQLRKGSRRVTEWVLASAVSIKCGGRCVERFQSSPNS